MREIIINKSKKIFDSLSKRNFSENDNLNKLLEEVQVLGFFFAKDKLYRLNEFNKIIGYDIHYRISFMFHLDIEGDFFCPKVQIDLNIPKDKTKSLTIRDCISEIDKDNKECELFITKILPYIFYLCSENAVIQERKLSKKHLRLYKDKSEIKPTINMVSKPVEEKVLTRIFPSSSTVIEGLNPSKKKGTTKCPHERRSHWHRYWVGKKDSDERRVVLKWISSMKIRADLKEIPNTEIKVKSSNYK